jgi:hypothetical protein
MVKLCGLRWCRSDTVDLGQNPVLRSYEPASKTSDFVVGRTLLERVTENQHLKNCVPLNYIYMY